MSGLVRAKARAWEAGMRGGRVGYNSERSGGGEGRASEKGIGAAVARGSGVGLRAW